MEEGKYILDIQKVNDFVMDNGSQRSNETEILEHWEADESGNMEKTDKLHLSLIQPQKMILTICTRR